MKSEGQNVDWVDRQRLADAHRVAAEYALRSPYHSEQERQERADHYRAEAERLEAML